MHQAPNVLSFRPQTVVGVESRPRWLRRDLSVTQEATFYEFLIDGRPLTELLEAAEGIARPDQETTNLGCSMVDAALSQLDHLLGAESPGTIAQRVWLLFCPVDHDPGCGGISARITWGPQTVTWSEFGWDDDVAGPVVPLSQHQHFTFDRHQYEKDLRALRAEFSARV